MNYIFHKSKIICLTFTIIGMLMLLLVTAYITNYKTERPVDFLSKNYIYMNIYNMDENNIKGRDFLDNILSLSDENLMVGKLINSDKSCAIYYRNDKIFPIKLVKGRYFTKEDFLGKKNVAIVNTTHKEIVRKKQKEYISFNGRLFKIVGYYCDENLANSKKWYVNMMAKSLKLDGNGDYFFESSDKSLKYKINDHCKKLQMRYEYTYNLVYGKNAEVKFTNFDVMVRFLLGSILLILVNYISMFIYWLKAKEEEKKVRFLTGADKKGIYYWLFKEYVILNIISFLISILCTIIFFQVSKKLPVAESVQIMFGNGISIQNCLIGLFFILILSFFIFLSLNMVQFIRSKRN